MQIHRHFNTLPAAARGACVALGTFDGFHRGHQAVVGSAGRVAREIGAPLGVVTTEPHPRLYFNPGLEPFLLTPFRAKTRHLEDFGVEQLYALPFDAALAATPADAFVADVLVGALGVRHVVAGYDYRFGKGRAGTAATLTDMAATLGFGATILDPVSFGVEGAAGAIYSSTLIRDTLKDGKARLAAALLGHWWAVEGHVRHGDRRGHTIGFPTANLAMEEYIKPRFGVYAVRVHLGHGGPVHDGVANIGRRPTFDKEEVLLEAHLFDFAADLYGAAISVELVAFIRAERKFDSLEALQAQIAADCATARLLLADPDNAADRFPPPRRNS